MWLGAVVVGLALLADGSLQGFSSHAQESVPPADVGSLPSPPLSDKDADHLVPAIAQTLRYLFNTLAIAGFTAIVLLAAMHILRVKVTKAREKQRAEQEQRKLAEADLARQRAHLLTILESLLDIYILVDEKGGCHAIVNNQNDPWWPTEAVSGMTVEDLFPADMVPLVRKIISQTLRENLSQTIEFKKNVGGDDGWFESRTAPLRTHADDPARVIWIVRNISTRMNAINNVRALSTRLSLVQERERQAIAADLHDTIGQNLAIARMKLGLLGKLEPAEQTRQIVADLVRDNEESMRVIRESINELSPPALHRLGLAAALEALAERFTREHGIQFRVKSIPGSRPGYERELRVIIFRIVRELMFNIVKHAQAKSANITMIHERNRLTVEVSDDGIGFDMDTSPVFDGKALDFQSDRFGLLTVRESVTYLGGEFAIRSEADVGTWVTIRIPIGTGAADDLQEKSA